MQRLIQWFRERLVAIKNWIFDKVINTRGGYFVVGLVIGSTLLFIYLVGRPVYQEFSEGYSTATKFLQIKSLEAVHQDMGASVSAGAYLDDASHGESVSSLNPSSPKTQIEKIADKIYMLESSAGKNDQKCERLGKHNGYGFGQWEGHNTCFSSDDETREQVIKWFENKLKTMTVEEALKLYSGDSISYVFNFNNLNV